MDDASKRKKKGGGLVRGRGPENKLLEEGKGGTFRGTSDGNRYCFLRKEERMGFK